MATNSKLARAKATKNDEFYTQWADIEREIQAYVEFDPDAFRNKTILCPCDDPEWSNFTKLLASRFEDFGIRKLISTSYAPESKAYKTGYQISLFEERDPNFDAVKTRTNGKIFILDRNGKRKSDKININDLKWDYMGEDGDFRSDEVVRLRDEADIIITNPPFSLFREFFAWVIEANKKFIIISNTGNIIYKDIFPLVKGGKIWSGNGFYKGNAYFASPFAKEYGKEVYNSKTGLLKFRNACWLTNIDHGRRHKPLELMTMAENLKFSKHKELRGRTKYQEYDNYDAIEVPYVDAIPSDYDGIMGVPASFFIEHCPEQFEIVGSNRGVDQDPNGVYGRGCLVNGTEKFKRLFIKKRK